MLYEEQQWMNAKGQLSGKRAYIRANVDASEAQSDHPIAVVVHIIMINVDADGIPASESELVALDDAEDRVAWLMCGQFNAIFALTVTSDGTRDLFFYLANEISDATLEVAFKELKLPRDYDFGIHPELGWAFYEWACQGY